MTLIFLLAQVPSFGQIAARDAYVRYELLAPPSTGVKVVSDVTVASPGATSYPEMLGKGVEATDVSAIDLMTGSVLTATQAPGVIRVALARPVPAGGAPVVLEPAARQPRRPGQGPQTLTFVRAEGRW